MHDNAFDKISTETRKIQVLGTNIIFSRCYFYY